MLLQFKTPSIRWCNFFKIIILPLSNIPLNVVHFTAHRKNLFHGFKVAKRPYFNTKIFENMNRPDLEHLQKFQNI